MSDTQDILESGIQSEFWHLFREYVEREWGPQGVRYQQEMDKALDMRDNDAAASQARQIRSGQKVILSLLRWPAEEAKRLADATPTTTDAGRAPMDPELVGMSRRGGGL